MFDADDRRDTGAAMHMRILRHHVRPIQGGSRADCVVFKCHSNWEAFRTLLPRSVIVGGFCRASLQGDASKEATVSNSRARQQESSWTKDSLETIGAPELGLGLTVSSLYEQFLPK
jgi:hypothetical protein